MHMAAAKKNEGPSDRELIYRFPERNLSKMDKLQKVYERWFKCTRCYLSQSRVTEDVVFGHGNPDARILIVGEAPGADEERDLVPFVGPSGQLMNQILAAVSDDEAVKDLSKWYEKAPRTRENMNRFHEEILRWRYDNFFVTNVVACRPPDNRQPLPPETRACWERLWNIIYIVDPWFIIASGATALVSLVRKKLEITKVRGQVFDMNYEGLVRPVTYPVMATLHPSYLLRKSDFKTPGGAFQKTVEDFRRAMDLIRVRKKYNQDMSMPPERGA
jgi:DNA polymerase